MRQVFSGRTTKRAAPPSVATENNIFNEIKEVKLKLSELEEAWERLKRPLVSKTLQDSLYTKILEMKANLEFLQSKLRRIHSAKTRPGLPDRVHG